MLADESDLDFFELAGAAEADHATTGHRPRWSPPSIDEICNWGKHKGMSYRALAARDPGYARWAASTIPGLRGQLCAEALAVHLGVTQ